MSPVGRWRASVGDVSPTQSALIGAVAFVAGYVLTLGLLLVDSVLAGGSDGGGSETPAQLLEFIGALFYNAHFSPLVIDSEFVTGPVDLLTETDLLFPTILYNCVPVAVLTLSGAVLVWRASDRLSTWESAAVVGASLVLAYLPLVLVGTQLFAFGGTQSGVEYTVSPPFRVTVARAGIALPVVFGGLGGYLAYLWRT